MGTYLSCGIATKLTIKKRGQKANDIMTDLQKELDLNIYNMTEDEEKVYLEIKEDIFEEYAVDFIKEQLSPIKENSDLISKSLQELKSLKGLNYEELLDIANNNSIYSFQFSEGYYFSNDVSYISSKYDIYADIINYIFDGKIIMECYSDIFRYIRHSIIASSNSPIKTAAVVSII